MQTETKKNPAIREAILALKARIIEMGNTQKTLKRLRKTGPIEERDRANMMVHGNRPRITALLNLYRSARGKEGNPHHSSDFGYQYDHNHELRKLVAEFPQLSYAQPSAAM